MTKGPTFTENSREGTTRSRSSLGQSHSVTGPPREYAIQISPCLARDWPPNEGMREISSHQPIEEADANYRIIQ
jgi:hypothetical protein